MAWHTADQRADEIIATYVITPIVYQKSKRHTSSTSSTSSQHNTLQPARARPG